MATGHGSTAEPGASDDHGTPGHHPRSVQGEKVVSQEQAARIEQDNPATSKERASDHPGGKSREG